MDHPVPAVDPRRGACVEAQSRAPRGVPRKRLTTTVPLETAAAPNRSDDAPDGPRGSTGEIDASGARSAPPPNKVLERTILLIEDNPGDARLLREMLAEQQSDTTTVIEVGSMSEAEHFLRDCSVDIVLLDLGLPDAQGMDAVRWAHGAAPSIPLVVLTGFDDENLAAQALQEGAQDFLIKGQIDTRGLLRALRYAVERKILEDTARALARAQGNFLASMSHELRTPLNAIIGFSRLIIDSGELRTPAVCRYSHLVEEASKTLLSIVDDVLDVSKMEAGSLDLDPRPFSPEQLVENTAELVRAQADAKGLELKVVVHPGLPAALVGDDARLRQVLLNLLSNAVKFTAKGAVRVSASSEPTADSALARVRFEVMDSGIGIPRAKQHRLFKRFSQVDSSISRQFGGSGLGLSICKSLVEMMGGTIDAESVEGQGSTFSFVVELPRVHASVDAEIVVAPLAPAARAGLRILLAEDVPMNQEYALALLGRWGFHVDVAGDGAAALDAVRRSTYDLVLMDVQMPVMDGVEATRRIRALGGAYERLPILAVTANVLTQDVAHFIASGMTGHVRKPFMPKELLAAIEKHVPSAEPTGDMQPGTGEGGLASVPMNLDHAVLDALWDAFGSDRMLSLVSKFEAQVAASFVGPEDEALDRARFLREAHSLASSAAVLGFRKLADECRDFEEACREAAMSGDELHSTLSRLRQAKAFAQRELRNALIARCDEPVAADGPVRAVG